MAKRFKLVDVKTFEEIRAREWTPVELQGDAIPEFLRGLPPEKLERVVASGTRLKGLKYSDDVIQGADLVGGMDVHRKAEEWDGVKWNMDWYAILCDPKSDTQLLVRGPFTIEDQHHVDEFRAAGERFLAVPAKPVADRGS